VKASPCGSIGNFSVMDKGVGEHDMRPVAPSDAAAKGAFGKSGRAQSRPGQ
jgi:hypothetical protein